MMIIMIWIIVRNGDDGGRDDYHDYEYYDGKEDGITLVVLIINIIIINSIYIYIDYYRYERPILLSREPDACEGQVSWMWCCRCLAAIIS